MGKTTNLKEPAVPHGADPDDIPGPGPESIAQPQPDVEAPARRVAPLRPAAPTEAQQLLERLLAVRNAILAAAVSQEKTLASIRGRQEREAVTAEPPARAQTGFFLAAAQLVADLEAAAKRITDQAQELRGRF